MSTIFTLCLSEVSLTTNNNTLILLYYQNTFSYCHYSKFKKGSF